MLSLQPFQFLQIQHLRYGLLAWLVTGHLHTCLQTLQLPPEASLYFTSTFAKEKFPFLGVLILHLYLNALKIQTKYTHQ
jgi:hypothetical protein